MSDCGSLTTPCYITVCFLLMPNSVVIHDKAASQFQLNCFPEKASCIHMPSYNIIEQGQVSEAVSKNSAAAEMSHSSNQMLNNPKHFVLNSCHLQNNLAADIK